MMLNLYMGPITVHPRVCGEHVFGIYFISIFNGSSPRLRGTHLPGIFCYQLQRFIPASAGNTLVHTSYNLPIPVHPRVCGEHCLFQFYVYDNTGSSPRLRGTHAYIVGRSPAVRFIPASAGNTRHRLIRDIEIGRFIPASHGEHAIRPTSRLYWYGSSPRLRGTQIRFLLCTLLIRFIPASAGNTTTR